MTDPTSPKRVTLRAPDPRTARTRAAIVTGLTTLLRSGRGDVTVRDVIAEAGVSRASFYTHFGGVDDVAIAVLRETFVDLRDVHVMERIALGGRTTASVRASQERLADAFWERRDLLRPLMSSSAAGPAYVTIVRAFADTIEWLAAASPERIPPGIDARIAATAVANTLIGLLTAWITGEIDADRDTIVDHLVAMLPGWMTTPDLPAAH